MLRIMDNQILTTGEVARICQASSRTAEKWIDDGLLKGYLLPGSSKRRVRRVTAGELKAFMVRHGMPFEEELERYLAGRDRRRK